MARKSKRMALLHEAIRQGQAKIAQGLESGQMRSDGSGPKCPKEKHRHSRTAGCSFKKQRKIPRDFGVIEDFSRRLGSGGFGDSAVRHLVCNAAYSRRFRAPSVQPPAEDMTDRLANAMEPEEPAEPIEQKKSGRKPDTGFFGFGGKKEPKEPPAEKTPVKPILSARRQCES